MGMVLGKISVETAKFELLHTCPDYEIRDYTPSVVAEVTYNPADLRNDRDGGFMILANYIGALGNPQNEKISMTTPVTTTTASSEKIDMTAPVITTTSAASSEKIAMTAPVITGGGGRKDAPVTMRFVLPSKYHRAEEAPKPTDGRVVVREEGERKYGVVRFSGVANDGVVEERVRRLRECLERDGYKVVGESVLARYNPPWTLPPFRTNEVMMPVE